MAGESNEIVAYIGRQMRHLIWVFVYNLVLMAFLLGVLVGRDL